MDMTCVKWGGLVVVVVVKVVVNETLIHLPAHFPWLCLMTSYGESTERTPNKKEEDGEEREEAEWEGKRETDEEEEEETTKD